MINEDLYRKCLESVAPKENKRMQNVAGSKGIWISQQDAFSRGQVGGRPKNRKVFFDPQDNEFTERFRKGVTLKEKP